MPTVANVTNFLRQFAPLYLAEEWDNVGLLLGNARTPVKKLMTCLTVTPESVSEAVQEKVQLIVSHHPVLFRGVQKLSSETPQGRLLLPLMKAGIAVYSPHTAFDNTAGGINEMLCEWFGLTRLRPLKARNQREQVKIVVFVPASDLEKVSSALFKAGAGEIGDYSHCSYRLQGTGTFFGGEETSPTIGSKGQLETVAEYRLEMVCAENRLRDAVHAIRQAHSYEEPAFDIYPLKSLPSDVGAGRIGYLPKEETLQQFAKRVRKSLKSPPVQVIGSPAKKVKKVAVASGAAGTYLPDCIRAKVDVFVTGEMRFHDYLTAQAEGVALVLPGHYATERPAVEQLAGMLQEEFPKVQVWASRKERDPVGVV